jgi:monodechloroaminopyrrolnitrin synthase
MQYSSPGLVVAHWLNNNEGICAIDPLGFDDQIQLLHVLNRSGDTNEIIQLLYRLLPVPDALDRYSYDESIAAMRDLGIFIGILKKHGIEPVEVVPELEYVLLVLMVKTDLPPRDTLLHYTVWNPDGDRMRTYTGLNDERSLIHSVKVAMPGLVDSIVQMQSLHDKELTGSSFELECLQLREKMQGMVNGIVHAKRNVSPAVFANELRFYYDPIKVDYNKDYIGPGAVEMPMFVFDHLLWSCDIPDKQYTDFKEGLLPYNLTFIRHIYERFDGNLSLLSRVEKNLRERPSNETCRAAMAVLELCSVLKSFRMPHKRVAEDAYAQGEDHHKEKGSGGYSTSILEHIIRLQNERISSLQACVANEKHRVGY